MPSNYRIEFSIQHAATGEDDYTEVGFGSSGSWADIDQAVHTVQSIVQNRMWETSGDMPTPDAVDGEDQSRE